MYRRALSGMDSNGVQGIAWHEIVMHRQERNVTQCSAGVWTGLERTARIAWNRKVQK